VEDRADADSIFHDSFRSIAKTIPRKTAQGQTHYESTFGCDAELLNERQSEPG